jgi:hypothetical protein
VYLGAVVALVSAMMHGVTSFRMSRLHRLLGADRRTLERWRRWWQATFPKTALWREARARFMPPVVESELPESLLKRFEGTLRVQLVLMLKLLLPLTTSTWSAMDVFDPQRMLAESGAHDR